MKQAIVYARVSTEEQAKHGYSLADQLSQCRIKAEQYGATGVFECVDEGISGDVWERPGLIKARHLVQSKTVELFVCYDPDRLARKLAHQLILTEELDRYDCDLLFVNFTWQNTPEGRLFYSLRGAIAEFEKEKIKERTRRGLRQKAEQGGLTHNPGAFGYCYNKQINNLDLVSKEAQTYLLMSKWFLEEQMGYSGIARRLTALGIPTKRGAPAWSASTVARMLTNPLYKGELWLQRYDTSGRRSNKHRPAEQRVKVKQRPKNEHILIAVPPIIDEATFLAQIRQAQVISRLYKKRSCHGDYLLSGLLRCGLCGSAMSGTKSGRRKYYRCGAGSSCSLPYFRVEVLEQPVWHLIRSWLEDEDAYPVVFSNSEMEASVIEQHLSQAVQERLRLITLIQKGLIPEEAIQDQLNTFAERINTLDSALAKLVECKQQLPAKNDLSTFLRQRLDTIDFSSQQRAIRNLVGEIHIVPGEILLKAKIPRPN